MAHNNNKKISAFQLAMITLAYVASIRMLPTMAEYGLSCLFFYFIAIVTFLIPTAFISAELGTTWPGRGGIYLWVKEGLGPRWGFLAIWFQFLVNIICLPAYLSFIGAAAAYLFFPELASNKLFLVIFILSIFWFVTLISFRGIQTAGVMNTMGALIGTYIPLGIVIFLGFYWMLSGHPSQVDLSLHAFIPNFSTLHLGDLVFLAGMLYAIMGIESSAPHALDVEDVEKNYPKGILLSVIMIVFVGFGAISIAIVIPAKDLSLTAGIMQAVTVFFNQLHVGWMIDVFALMIVFGAMCALNSSVIGPSRGFFGSASSGDIPPILVKTNKHGMPVNMFIFQAITVSFISCLFFLMPSINSSYWIIMVIATTLGLTYYILLFIAAIRLRYTQPNKKRYYKVPFGNAGMWVLVVLGIMSSLFGIGISFIPPSQVATGSLFVFELTIISGLIFFIGIGFLIFALRKPEWVVKIK
jgi:amino acid transporter